MVVNGHALLQAAPIKEMLDHKRAAFGVSHGLTEAGYDIQIAEDVIFEPAGTGALGCAVPTDTVTMVNPWSQEPAVRRPGRFALASASKPFQMPTDMVGYVKDKSTWARQGLSVLNTVIEPGWHGFLTLELVYHGSERLVISAGTGIAQVLFHKLQEPATYTGKYQNQGPGAQGARHE